MTSRVLPASRLSVWEPVGVIGEGEGQLLSILGLDGDGVLGRFYDGTGDGLLLSIFSIGRLFWLHRLFFGSISGRLFLFPRRVATSCSVVP